MNSIDIQFEGARRGRQADRVEWDVLGSEEYVQL